MYKDKTGGMNINIKLGDMVEKALSAVGITSERVERWVGHPCGCKERKERLNRLSAWAMRILTGRTEEAEKHLDSLLVDEKDKEKGQGQDKDQDQE